MLHNLYTFGGLNLAPRMTTVALGGEGRLFVLIGSAERGIVRGSRSLFEFEGLTGPVVGVRERVGEVFRSQG